MFVFFSQCVCMILKFLFTVDCLHLVFFLCIFAISSGTAVQPFTLAFLLRFSLGNIKIKQFKNNLLLMFSHTRAFVPFFFFVLLTFRQITIFNTYFVCLLCFTLVTLTTFLCFFLLSQSFESFALPF